MTKQRDMSRPSPNCIFCEQNGVLNPARFVAAQSTDAGETIEWVLICAEHADGWNDGGDWSAPMYAIVEAKEKGETNGN